ncbi:helix-turn-helix domain-containing protein [Sphingomonas lenta]|uniref:AraC family transcriptional regulator n=1 Tax=Sphingomonas lenta TaxID=1141887 RepID=A0A2A2SET4_9SPHN|nr:AraC family transcriptional regulator [Sphingomonas lenta]PAX07715.1 AraC family transcriptional regulator [Sphingomonas lenta]
MAKHRIEVSPEMLSFVGSGTVAPEWPDDRLVLLFTGLDASAPALVTATRDPDPAELSEAALVFAVAETACRRLFGLSPDLDTPWHLPADLRAIALAVRDCSLPEPARETMRLAKSIELLCAVFTALGEGALVPADGAGELREGDAVRIVAARRLVDERWHEKLTLDAIARACGLNRAKLTRGFRLMFDCSVADALAENRLAGARRLLLATDLPVSSIGYRCGYNNNASFTRAFSRRWGVPPTQLRQLEVAA